MLIRLGASAVHEFIVNDDDMHRFQQLSNDRSLVHTDDAFARKLGFERVIVYGGIVVAHLSHVVGTFVPGTHGTSLQWRIDFRNPLYVREPAVLKIWVTNVSAAVGVVECQFEVSTGEKIIATGTTRSVPTARGSRSSRTITR